MMMKKKDQDQDQDKDQEINEFDKYLLVFFK